MPLLRPQGHSTGAAEKYSTNCGPFAFAVFTLLAWAFAYLFIVLQALDPGGFNPSGAGTRTWMELLFLSFTTLSSTGLSDITPISGHARSVPSRP